MTFLIPGRSASTTTGCSADDAFDLLREQSQRENRKLREIAQEIVDRQKR